MNPFEQLSALGVRAVEQASRLDTEEATKNALVNLRRRDRHSCPDAGARCGQSGRGHARRAGVCDRRTRPGGARADRSYDPARRMEPSRPRSSRCSPVRTAASLVCIRTPESATASVSMWAAASSSTSRMAGSWMVGSISTTFTPGTSSGRDGWIIKRRVRSPGDKVVRVSHVDSLPLPV